MIFISYSHVDEVLKDWVVRHLQVLADAAGVSVWEDRQISTGQEWSREIETALSTASAAVLLLSVDFLNSRFIKESELPKLLARREKEGLRVFPILARPCNWKNVRLAEDHTALAARRQAIVGNGRALTRRVIGNAR